jgi:hypothetical protein
VKSWGIEHRCASTRQRRRQDARVELRANQVIPPAEEAIITASRTYNINVESSIDEMILKAIAPLVLRGVVASPCLEEMED